MSTNFVSKSAEERKILMWCRNEDNIYKSMWWSNVNYRGEHFSFIFQNSVNLQSEHLLKMKEFAKRKRYRNIEVLSKALISYLKREFQVFSVTIKENHIPIFVNNWLFGTPFFCCVNLSLMNIQNSQNSKLERRLT